MRSITKECPQEAHCMNLTLFTPLYLPYSQIFQHNTYIKEAVACIKSSVVK